MGRILAIDLGSARIGVAVTDETGAIAQAYTVILHKSRAEDIARLRSIIDELSVETLVVGLPRNMDGSYGQEAEKARRFAAAIAEETGKRVVLHDERLTTSMATRALIEADMRRSQRKRAVDKVAAQMILQSYLDRQRALIDTHNLVG